MIPHPKRRLVMQAIIAAGLGATLSSHLAPAFALSLADLKKKGELAVGMLVDFPPYGTLNASNQPDGYDADVARLLAKDLGLNLDKFKADIDGQECKAQIGKQQQELSTVGVDGTPAFFVNGRPISGAQPFENFKAGIGEEMKKAGDAIKSGVKPEDYYQKVVVEKGKKST